MKNKTKFIISSFLAMIFMATAVIALNNNAISYNTNPNVNDKVIGSELFSASRIAPESLDDVLKHADLVVIGTVVSESKLLKKSYLTSELQDLGDKVKDLSKQEKELTFNVSQVEIKVHEVIHGNIDTKTILFNQLGSPESDDFQTKVKNGEKILFVLKMSDDGTYASVDFEEGLFKILDNDTTMSMSKNLNIAKYDDIHQDILVKDIKNYFEKDK